MLLLILLNIGLFLFCPTFAHKYEEIVNTAIEGERDVEREKYAREHFRTFSKALSVANMKLLYAEANISRLEMFSSTDSDAHEALVEYQQRKKKLEKNRKIVSWKMQDRFKKLTAASATEMMMKEYEEKVKNQITIMKTLSDQYLNMSKKNTSLIDTFSNACNVGDSAPNHIIEYIRHRLVDECTVPINEDDIQTLASQRSNMMSLFLRFQDLARNNAIPDPGVYLTEFLAFNERFNIKADDPDVLNSHSSSYKDTIKEYFRYLREHEFVTSGWDSQNGCLLRSIVYTSFFNYPAIQAYQSELEEQLKELKFLAKTCENVIHHREVEKFKKQVADDMDLIYNHTRKWFNESLASTWPTVHNEILKEQLMQNVPISGFFDKETLQTIANLTHPLLINTGLPGYTYKIFIIKGLKKTGNHYFEGDEKNCTFQKGAFGYDTVIRRVPLGTTPQKETVRWSKLERQVKNKMSKQYDALLVDGLKGSLLQDFQCWSIINEWSSMPWKPCPKIDYFMSPSDGVFTFNYTNVGSFWQKCEEYRFFFFS